MFVDLWLYIKSSSYIYWGQVCICATDMTVHLYICHVNVAVFCRYYILHYNQKS